MDMNILSKGLSFVPTERFDPFMWTKDLALFGRKLKWKKFFETTESSKYNSLGITPEDRETFDNLLELDNEGLRQPGLGPFTNLKKKSEKQPPRGDLDSVDIFLKVVAEDLRELSDMRSKVPPNLIKVEMDALMTLAKRKDLVFKPSDKGGNIVVMNHEMYQKMCYSILRDRDGYATLERDPTAEFSKTLIDILSDGLGDRLISQNELEFMHERFPVTPTFYTLPKVHKGISPLKGRPIVAGINSLTQNVGVYLDSILRPFVVSLSSYLRDTSDLLTKINGVTIEQDTIFASIDVEALYSSIPHELGLKALKHFLDSRGTHYEKHSRFTLKLMDYILTHNFFTFNGKYYHQLRGTAMGCSCAPSYANLYLGWWEDTMVFQEPCSKWVQYITYWGRYIDDVLVLWTGTVDSFQEFVKDLNINNIGLSFTYDIGINKLAFLDVLLMRGTEGQIETQVFRKETATNSLLHWTSHHPEPLKKGIPKGQYLRLKRNCSTSEAFHKQAGDLCLRFSRRGYPVSTLKKAYNNAVMRDREDLLMARQKEEREKIIRVIGTFDNHNREIYTILEKHWGILRADPNLREFVGVRPMITFRKGKSLKDRLVHSFYQAPQKERTWLERKIDGVHRCGHCKFCRWIRPGKKVVSASTNREYLIRDFANCGTEGVIYVAICTCPLNYIGKTKRELRKRIGEHLGDIRNERDTSISRHIRQVHGGDLNSISFKIIEVVPEPIRKGNWNKILLQRESRWIYRFDCVHPKGLNEQLTFGCFL
ncbi:uncharacterized protein ACNLHF_016739 [Anomaloglossus baeobatrachus]